MDKATFGVDELATTMGISRPKAYELVNSDRSEERRVGKECRL